VPKTSAVATFDEVDEFLAEALMTGVAGELVVSLSAVSCNATTVDGMLIGLAVSNETIELVGVGEGVLWLLNVRVKTTPAISANATAPSAASATNNSLPNLRRGITRCLLCCRSRFG
jgi:hypothetical protein